MGFFQDIGNFFKDPIGQIATGIDNGISTTFGGGLPSAASNITPLLNYQQQQNAYNSQIGYNQQVMDREDTAVQRRKADLMKAGYSPTLAAGSAASSTSLHTGTASQLESTLKPQIENMQYQQSKLGIDLTKAQIAQTSAQTESSRKNTEVAGSTLTANNIENNYKKWLYEKLKGSPLIPGAPLPSLLNFGGRVLNNLGEQFGNVAPSEPTKNADKAPSGEKFRQLPKKAYNKFKERLSTWK